MVWMGRNCDCMLYFFLSLVEWDEYCENVHHLYWIKFPESTAGLYMVLFCIAFVCVSMHVCVCVCVRACMHILILFLLLVYLHDMHER